jgi:hypothetical protein
MASSEGGESLGGDMKAKESSNLQLQQQTTTATSLSSAPSPPASPQPRYGTLPFFNQSRLNFEADGGSYNTVERARRDEVDFISYWFSKYQQRQRLAFIVFAIIGVLIGTPSVSSTGESPLLPRFIVSWIYWAALPIELSAIGIALTFVITGPTKPRVAGGIGELPSWFEECGTGIVLVIGRLSSIFWSSTPLESLSTTFSPWGVGFIGVLLVGPLAMRYVPAFQVLAPLAALGAIGHLGTSSLLGLLWAIFVSASGVITGFASLVFAHRDEMNLRQFW